MNYISQFYSSPCNWHDITLNHSTSSHIRPFPPHFSRSPASKSAVKSLGQHNPPIIVSLKIEIKLQYTPPLASMGHMPCTCIFGLGGLGTGRGHQIPTAFPLGCGTVGVGRVCTVCTSGNSNPDHWVGQDGSCVLWHVLYILDELYIGPTCNFLNSACSPPFSVQKTLDTSRST